MLLMTYRSIDDLSCHKSVCHGAEKAFTKRMRQVNFSETSLRATTQTFSFNRKHVMICEWLSLPVSHWSAGAEEIKILWAGNIKFQTKISPGLCR